MIGRAQRLTIGQVDMKIKIPNDELCWGGPEKEDIGAEESNESETNGLELP